MANVLVDDTSLTAIANAIREKNGKLIKYKPSEMAQAISKLSASSGTGGIVIGGDCSRLFAGINNFITNYGNQITTENVSNAEMMFYNNGKSTEIPFDINFSGTQYNSINRMFYGCNSLRNPPKMNNTSVYNPQQIFYECYKLRNIPDDFASTWNWDSTSSYYENGMFYECYSLRSIPMNMINCANTSNINYSHTYFYNGFTSCCSLDELVNLPVLYTDIEVTSNMFNGTFMFCSRIKNITFATQDDGTPYKASWKNQTIYLNSQVGWSENTSYILNQNSGITADKEVTNSTTYASLKNDPDWFTRKIAYSRYNHDSAVATINSLPDTSEYLTANGGTNTITFYGSSGSLTDGGAINTLTESEIAVATAKGWTCSFT